MALTNQKRNMMTAGFTAAAPGTGTVSLALSSAAGAGGWGTGFSQTGLAYSFVPSVSKQVSKVSAYCAAVTGTLGASDLVCNIYSDSSGSPGTSIEQRATVTATPTGAAWVEFTGFTATSTLTAGTQYWIVLRNANATPTSNSPTYRYGSSNTIPTIVNGLATAPAYGISKAHTTDGGATWGTTLNSICGFMIEYSDGTGEGVPVSNIAQATGDYVYSSREVGTMLALPGSATYRISGISFPVNKTGTTMDDYRTRLYVGSGASPTLLATSVTVLKTNVGGSSFWLATMFSDPVAISGGQVVRAVMTNTSSNGSTSHAFRTHTYSILDTTLGRSMFGFGTQNFQKTISTDGGATFAETTGEFIPFALLIDSTEGAIGGGGVIGG